MTERLEINFWGVRGSIPCPGSETVRYGGNTACVEMIAGGRRLIFDGGTGLRILGERLMNEAPLRGYIFFTHAHWDHIQGFPFFRPAFEPGNRFEIYGARQESPVALKQVLTEQMRNPHFPIPLREMGAQLTFHEFKPGATFTIADESDTPISVSTAPLNHPGGAVGYRVSWQGRVAAYVTDTEQPQEGYDENVLELARDADVLIHDCTYTDAEYKAPDGGRAGWGHSTWQAAAAHAKAANVQKLVLFHHDPTHDDAFLDKMGEDVASVFPNSVMAREGLSIPLLPK